MAAKFDTYTSIKMTEQMRDNLDQIARSKRRSISFIVREMIENNQEYKSKTGE